MSDVQAVYLDWFAIANRLQGKPEQLCELNNLLLTKLFQYQEPISTEIILQLDEELQEEHGIYWLLEVIKESPFPKVQLRDVMQDYQTMAETNCKRMTEKYWGKALVGIRPMPIFMRYIPQTMREAFETLPSKIVIIDSIKYIVCYVSFGQEQVQCERTMIPATVYMVPLKLLDIS